jgi:hypothetical protein
MARAEGGGVCPAYAPTLEFGRLVEVRPYAAPEQPGDLYRGRAASSTPRSDGPNGRMARMTAPRRPDGAQTSGDRVGPSASADGVGAPPPGRIRLAVSCFIGAWLLWQVSVPLGYYVRDYRTGEAQEEQRFSWRMFSHLWMLQRGCNIAAFDLVAPSHPGGPPTVHRLDLWRRLESIWVEQLREGRRPVMEEFLRSRCESDPSVVQAELIRTCPIAPGSRLPELNLRLVCRAGAPSAPR